MSVNGHTGAWRDGRHIASMIPTEGELLLSWAGADRIIRKTGAGTYCQRLSSHRHHTAVGDPTRRQGSLRPQSAHRPSNRPATQQSTTSVLTTAVLVYTLGAGITAAAGTRLALQLILITVFGLHPFQVSPIEVTGEIAAVRRCLSKKHWHWAICVPAAHLGSGSRFSGSLSGIEP